MNFAIRIWSLMLCVLLVPVLAAANPVADATQRMKDRLPQLDALKEEGSIGEAATGYLAVRTELSKRLTDLVTAENADRKTVYAAVAERTGQSLEEVGQQRALRIIDIAASGVWVQDARGAWVQKP